MKKIKMGFSRKVFSYPLILFGLIFMLLSTETLAGVALMALGISVELAAKAIKQK